MPLLQSYSTFLNDTENQISCQKKWRLLSTQNSVSSEGLLKMKVLETGEVEEGERRGEEGKVRNTDSLYS